MKPGSRKTGDEQVGDRIAARRKALEMTRDDLATAIGASYALVAQIETGWRMPSYEKQLLIAKALGAGLDELFGEATEDALTLSAPPLSAEAPGVDFSAAAEAAFPLGALPVHRRARSAPATAARTPIATPPLSTPPLSTAPQSSASPAPKPTFDEAVERAATALRDLPPSRRLDALSRVQLIVTREVVDEERRRVGSDQRPAGWITDLAPGEVFVFGSNADGRHAGGASRIAFERFGAQWGEGRGRHGQSYAIVTTEGLGVLRDEVARFLGYARRHAELRFLVTPIGTGVAGFRADEIAPMFAGAPDNVVLPVEFGGP